MSGGGSNDDGGQDFELNLAPIIDCFTVLITYMLVSASFISLDILEVSVNAANPQTEQQQTPPEMQVSLGLVIKAAHELDLVVTGKGTEHIAVASAANAVDLVRLRDQVKELQGRYPALQEISVRAEPGVQYREIVNVVEGLKKSMPKVYLGD